jgi:thioredoxin reductase (NADPH)
LERSFSGGRLLEAHSIENYSGFPEALSGYDLAMKMVSQLEKFEGKINHNEEAVALSLDGEKKIVTTRSQAYTTKAVILAIGVQRRRLLITGEKELIGRGVSYCATCDGPLFKDKHVAVIGSGNEGLEEAIYLSELASKVFLIPNDLNLKAPRSIINKFEEKDNTQIIREHEVEMIGGKASVESLRIRNLRSKKVRTLRVNAVFIAIGYVPVTEIIKQTGVEIDQKGWIQVDGEQRTNLAGVFAAGDCTGKGLQVATAVGQGAMAALSASRYIK